MEQWWLRICGGGLVVFMVLLMCSNGGGDGSGDTHLCDIGGGG